MIGFLYTGNDKISKIFDQRLSKTFGYEIVHHDLKPKGEIICRQTGSPFEDNPLNGATVTRYLCIDSNKMLFSHNIMNKGTIIPQENPDINFYITINVKSPNTVELVKDVHSIQEIWHDFGLCPEEKPLLETTNLAFDLFDSDISYPRLNDKIKDLCGENSGFYIEHHRFGGGLQCYYKDSPCSIENLFKYSLNSLSTFS